MSETDRLLASLDLDDQVFMYQPTVSGEERRAGVLVVTEWEMANLQRFGDVLWLDGTSLKNDLGWTTWPITLCDDRKKLTSGGVFFTAFENEEAFVWLLQTLEPLVHNQLKTIFTDEDSALCPAIVWFRENVRGDVFHRICYWHKRRNFRKAVDRARVTPTVRDEALRLFDVVCKDPADAEVEEAIAKIRLLIPSIAEYLEREVCSRLDLFTEAFRGGALTLGYSTTGLSESANNLIRRILPAALLSLIDIRKGVTKAYQIKALGDDRTILHERHPQGAREAWLHGAKLEKPIIRWIEEISKAADACTITLANVTVAEDSDVQFFEACVQGHRSFLIRQTPSELACECDRLSGTGLPCCHLVALFRKCGHGFFPVQLIARRWIRSPGASIPALPVMRIQDDDSARKVVAASVTSDEDDDQRPTADGDDQLPGPADEPPARLPGQSRRYQILNVLGKQIAQKGADNPDKFEAAHERLVELLDSMTEERDGDVRDARGRPKGRPRKHGHSQPDDSPGPKPRCPLCDSDAHKLTKCPHYPIFDDERREYDGSTEGRCCSLCLFAGHRKSNCPVLLRARERVAEERLHHRRH
jgi:hypothetical protein